MPLLTVSQEKIEDGTFFEHSFIREDDPKEHETLCFDGNFQEFVIYGPIDKVEFTDEVEAVLRKHIFFNVDDVLNLEYCDILLEQKPSQFYYINRCSWFNYK